MLDTKEKNYAYFMSKASWAGSKILFHELSYESPALCCLLLAFFQQDFETLESSPGITKKEFIAFKNYAAGFFSNFSNYTSFGHSKFTPAMSQDRFEAILQSHPDSQKEGSLYRQVF